MHMHLKVITICTYIFQNFGLICKKYYRVANSINYTA